MTDLMRRTTVCKTMTTETAHRLTDYTGKCASIHGHSYKWEVTACLAEHGVGQNGISIDFGDLKKAMREVIYDPFDHALVLDSADVLLAVRDIYLDAKGEPQKVLEFPGNTTAENFARYVAEGLQQHLDAYRPGERAIILRVRVWETENSYGQWVVDGDY